MTQNQKSLDPVIRSRLHEEIVYQIQNKILKGEFAVGDKLPSERELAINLNVNRATVREALKKLEILGLVEILHGDGIYIKDYLESANLEILNTMMYTGNIVNPEILKNILDIRKILVPEMAFLAAENRTDDDLEKLEKIAYLDTNDIPVMERDLSVHHIIAMASKNLFYILILNFFNRMFRDNGYIYFNNAENCGRSVKFHKDIYEAIMKKKAASAKKIMKDVLIYTEEQIYSNFESNL